MLINKIIHNNYEDINKIIMEALPINFLIIFNNNNFQVIIKIFNSIQI